MNENVVRSNNLIIDNYLKIRYPEKIFFGRKVVSS